MSANARVVVDNSPAPARARNCWRRSIGPAVGPSHGMISAAESIAEQRRRRRAAPTTRGCRDRDGTPARSARGRCTSCGMSSASRSATAAPSECATTRAGPSPVSSSTRAAHRACSASVCGAALGARGIAHAWPVEGDDAMKSARTPARADPTIPADLSWRRGSAACAARRRVRLRAHAGARRPPR